MPLETATRISGLVAANPASSDGLNQADDHLRLIKSVLLNDVGGALNGGKLTTVDGSAAAPSIGFAADATAGFYRKGTGQTSVVGSLIGQGTVDIGFLSFYAGSTVPNGYLACDGQAVSRTTYAALFATIGTTWGAGDGSTTFNVPNLLDRYPRHRNVGGTRAGAVGTLQADVIKNHQHPVAATTGVESANHTHTYSGTTGNDSPDHSHNTTLGTNNGVSGGSTFVSYTSYAVPGVLSTTNTTPVASGGASARHQHGFSGTTSSESGGHTHSFSVTSDFPIGGDAETRPLSATLLFCIRAL